MSSLALAASMVVLTVPIIVGAMVGVGFLALMLIQSVALCVAIVLLLFYDNP